MLKRKNKLKKSIGEHIFDTWNIIGFALLCFIFVYPFLNVVVVSLNDPIDAMRGGIYFWPRKFSVENYKKVLTDPMIYTGYAVTIARTVIGSITHVLCTATFAYGLSKKDLLFRPFYTMLCMITMYFGGGLIPSYLLMKSLHLTNNFLIYIIPGLYSIWDAMIFKTFYKGIPSALEEAAKIDGCNDLGAFFKIVFPLAKPCVAAILLFNGVGHWNSWFDGYIYIKDEHLLPLQTILMRVINESSAAQSLEQAENMMIKTADGSASKITAESVRYATMVVAIGPIILIYPFLQKYFEKGVMMGSVKE